MRPADDPLVPVGLGPGGERGQVGAGVGLAEQLAPDLLAGQQRAGGSAPSAPRCRRAGGWARPSRCRSGCRGGGCRPAGAPRRRPAARWGRRRARRARASAGPRARARPAAGARARGARQPVPELDAARVVVTGQRGIHGGQRRLPGFAGRSGGAADDGDTEAAAPARRAPSEGRSRP